MFREMRRKKQALSAEECTAILHSATSGVLAVSGDDDYPYAVPMSYVYDGSSLYFHCAKTGHKLDAIRRNNKVSFCIIDQDQIVPEEYTSYFRSVIVFGKIHILEDAQEKRVAIEKLVMKYAPNDAAGRREASDQETATTCLLKMTVDHMTGKEASELVQQKQLAK